MTDLRTSSLLNVLGLTLAVALLGGCGDSDEDSDSDGNTSGDTSSNTGANSDDMVAQTLTFAVSVGDQDFTCGGTFSGLGSTGNGELTIVDARFYVHNVILIADDGTTEPLEMDDTGIWQTSGVALLDFEDGCGDGGSTEVNATITGMAPNKTYTGIEFTVGLPPELNSMDIVLEMRGSPLNITSMWWSWQSGYKFIRIDTMNDFRIHLGSAGCGEDFNCTAPNQPTFRIDGMDLATQTVTLDVAALVSGTDVTQNTDMTAPGCMSGAGDPECVGIFDALGLEYDGVASSGQKAFIAR